MHFLTEISAGPPCLNFANRYLQQMGAVQRAGKMALMSQLKQAERDLIADFGLPDGSFCPLELLQCLNEELWGEALSALGADSSSKPTDALQALSNQRVFQRYGITIIYSLTRSSTQTHITLIEFYVGDLNPVGPGYIEADYDASDPLKKAADRPSYKTTLDQILLHLFADHSEWRGYKAAGIYDYNCARPFWAGSRPVKTAMADWDSVITAEIVLTRREHRSACNGRRIFVSRITAHRSCTSDR